MSVSAPPPASPSAATALPAVLVLPALSPTPINQQARPVVSAAAPTPQPETESLIWRTAFSALSYFIIAIIVILIIVIAIILPRLLWGQMDRNREYPAQAVDASELASQTVDVSSSLDESAGEMNG